MSLDVVTFGEAMLKSQANSGELLSISPTEAEGMDLDGLLRRLRSAA